MLITSGCASLNPATQPAPTESTTEASQSEVPSEPETTDPSESTDAETTEAPTTEKTTCKTLIPEVVRISKESENDVKVLQVYRPKTIKDRQDSYAAGELKVRRARLR